MTVAFFCLIAVVGIFLFLFVFWPFFIKLRSSTGIAQIEGFSDYHLLLQEKEVLLDNLKELELDLQMQKLDPNDYENLKSNLVMKLGEVMKQIRDLESKNDFLKNVHRDVMKVEA